MSASFCDCVNQWEQMRKLLRITSGNRYKIFVTSDKGWVGARSSTTYYQATAPWRGAPRPRWCWARARWRTGRGWGRGCSRSVITSPRAASTEPASGPRCWRTTGRAVFETIDGTLALLLLSELSFLCIEVDHKLKPMHSCLSLL